MSEINYQALREAAEKATWGDWDSYKPHRGARGYEVRLSSQAIAQHVLKNNAEFIAAFNPKVALALLDERERNQQYIKSRDQENEDIALTVGKLRVELEAAEKRIAELEAEPVSNSDELPLDYLQGHKDGLEWAAQLAEANHPQTGDWLYDDPIDLARAIRKGPDMPTVQAGNYPVTPDGWISCSERMPAQDDWILIYSKHGEYMAGQVQGEYVELSDGTLSWLGNALFWMPLPEPPQEAK
ncbi:ead/Ea22-like family protein [Escherichia coli]|uniref:ead/Ea22-like family protein n=1 Tax=Escherichia coli TaxID=562 RepID=UPI00259D1DEE|nr:ead/Ea22-like family protein [Escherichia coli]UGH62690.1 ead/Ea22-like family protein [Escherichia coli]WJL82419.1 ead/Ea22-like family protein [Escherichia coli O2:K1:H7]